MLQLNFPISARICVTNRCNAKCIHCYQNSGTPLNKELNTREWKNIIKQLADNGIFTLLFTGGEPLVRKDINELIEYANSKGLVTSINTNGLLINKRKIKILSKVGLVKISIDSFNKDKNDFWRGVNGYTKKAISSVKLLKKNRISTAIQTTLSRFNITEIEEMIKNTKKLGATQFFSFFVPYGRGEALKDLLINKGDLKEFFEYIKNRKERFPRIVVHYPLSFLLKKRKEDAIISGCPLGNFGVSIEADGSVLPCPYWKKKLGNLRTESFSKIWKRWKNSKLCQNLLDNSNLRGKCLGCKYKAICGGGCRALSYYINEDMYAPDPLCFVKKTG